MKFILYCLLLVSVSGCDFSLFGTPKIKTVGKIAIPYEKDSILALVYTDPYITIESTIQVRKVHKEHNEGRILHIYKYKNCIDTFYVQNQTELVLVVRDSITRYEGYEGNKPMKVSVDFGK